MGNKLTIKELFSEPFNPNQFGIFVYGKLHDIISDELTANASAQTLKSIHPEWKVEVHPVDENGNIITTDINGSVAMNEGTSSSNRMVELIKSFEEKNEIIKEKTKNVDSKKLEEECQRLKEIAKLDEANMMNFMNGNMPPSVGSNTMNTAFDPRRIAPGETINTIFANTQNQNLNPNTNKPYNPNYTYLQPNEALRLSISRTLNSGAPVNNLGFYEEINRELNNLGFNAKSPLDIKQTLLAMIKD